MLFAAHGSRLYTCPAACEIEGKLRPVMYLDDETDDPFAIRGVEKASLYLAGLVSATRILKDIAAMDEAY